MLLLDGHTDEGTRENQEGSDPGGNEVSDVRLAGCRDSSPSLLIDEVFCQTTGSGLQLMIFTDSTAVRKENNVEVTYSLSIAS